MSVEFVDLGDEVLVPGETCPECNAPVVVELLAAGDDGVPEDPFVRCEKDDHGDADPHVYSQASWQPVFDRARAWVRENLRCRP